MCVLLLLFTPENTLAGVSYYNVYDIIINFRIKIITLQTLATSNSERSILKAPETNKIELWEPINKDFEKIATAITK